MLDASTDRPSRVLRGASHVIRRFFVATLFFVASVGADLGGVPFDRPFRNMSASERGTRIGVVLRGGANVTGRRLNGFFSNFRALLRRNAEGIS
jgi:hypothetical protein